MHGLYRVGLRLSPVRLVLALIRALPGFPEGEEMLARCSRPPRAAWRSCRLVLPDGGPVSVGGSRPRCKGPAHTCSGALPLYFGSEELTCSQQAEDVVLPKEACCLVEECTVSSSGCSGGMRLDGLATGVHDLWLVCFQALKVTPGNGAQSFFCTPTYRSYTSNMKRAIAFLNL